MRFTITVTVNDSNPNAFSGSYTTRAAKLADAVWLARYHATSYDPACVRSAVLTDAFTGDVLDHTQPASVLNRQLRKVA